MQDICATYVTYARHMCDVCAIYAECEMTCGTTCGTTKMTLSDYGELGKLYGLNRKLMGVKKGVKFYLCIHNLLLKYPQIPANTPLPERILRILD